MNVRLTVFKWTPKHNLANIECQWINVGDWVLVGNFLPLRRFDSWEEAMEFAIALKTFVDVNFKKPNREEK